MNPIFDVQIRNGASPFRRPYTDFVLPATPYELMDALERAQVESVEKAEVVVSVSCADYKLLGVYLPLQDNLYELNVLASKLSQLTEYQRIEFCGLVQMEALETQDLISARRLIDLAYNADCCQIAPCHNDYQLGKFYVENGFVPETDDLSDEVISMLDFKSIGCKMRTEEKGVFTEWGYVVQISEIEPVADSMDFALEHPEYLFRIGIENVLSEDGTASSVAYLDFPTTMAQIQSVPKQLGLDGWEGTAIHNYDGIIPKLQAAVCSVEDLKDLNELAHSIQSVIAGGKLPKYKALLDALGCSNLAEAIPLAETLSDYSIAPNVRTPEDFAQERISMMLSDDEADMVLRHLNRYAYGDEVIAQMNGSLTEHGLISRIDRQPICIIEEHSRDQPMMCQ